MNREMILDENTLSKIINQGSVALFPTDTLPALAVNPENALKLWKIKKRSFDKPLILMGSTMEELFSDVLPVAIDDAWLVAEKYWPGALTMVVPASGEVVNYLNPEESTLGLRIPNLKQVINLLALTGPLATTSANISGSDAAKNAQEAASIFPDIPLLGPDPWPIHSEVASTVIYWKGKRKWKVLRSGEISQNEDWEK